MLATTVWIVSFVLLSAICAWIVLGDGVERIDGLIAAVYLGAEVHRWSELGIRVFVALTWLVSAAWFVLGLFVSDARWWVQ